jgi:GH15 family glucan-1,4-alpha-glucosidase
MTHPRLQVVYDVFGTPDLREQSLDHLEGYRHSQPVRVGNGASEQAQLDVYGEVMNATSYCLPLGIKLDRDTKRLLKGIAEYVWKKWQEPDHGIWEFRSGQEHFVHSKVFAWLALKRASEMAERALLENGSEYSRKAAMVAKAVNEQGFNGQLYSYTQTFGGTTVDASLLQLPLVGFVEASDPRMVGTIEAIRRELGKEDLVLRYKRPDGLHGEEGAFLACSFWLVDCLAKAGFMDEAYKLFERLVARANDVGLYAEEIDMETGVFLHAGHHVYSQ